ncbi:hypothetical protein [Chitinophaga niabensis]|uniref:DUF3945 domain-containing protein n=1 Tax=Chitinophaga niabensis TaxID=536979 RepID=A0A1N6KAH4_9BACT|nr:hypothetical protein [Chitinophaga niabensis]SIO53548.1 hypothetical protein SAMN04488055_5435 [Chitinophaga niabensis]
MKQVNVENHDYLCVEVFPRLGLEGVFNDALMAAMKNGEPTIILEASAKYGKNNEDLLVIKPRLDLNEEDGRYYANAITASLTQPGKESFSLQFDLYAQKGYSIDDMYKMMDAKYIHQDIKRRDGTRTERWSRVEFKKNEEGKLVPYLRHEYSDSTNFNLIKELGRLPLGMTQQEKEDMIFDMKHGDPGVAMIRKPDGSRERVTLVPNPKTAQIHVFDRNGNRLMLNDNKVRVETSQKFVVVGSEDNNNITPAAARMLEGGNDQGEGQDRGRGQGQGRGGRRAG